MAETFIPPWGLPPSSIVKKHSIKAIKEREEMILLADYIEGAVTIINTISQANGQDFPVAMAEDINLRDGTYSCWWCRRSGFEI